MPPILPDAEQDICSELKANQTANAIVPICAIPVALMMGLNPVSFIFLIQRQLSADVAPQRGNGTLQSFVRPILISHEFPLQETNCR